MKKNYLAMAIATVLLFTSCSAGALRDSPSRAPQANGAPENRAYEGASEYLRNNASAQTDTYGLQNRGENYLDIIENDITQTAQNSMLTFSLKVDTASYSNVERYIKSGNIPPTDAVRTEEMINYFSYDNKMVFGDEPFSIYTEIGPSPFDAHKQLAFVRVKTKDIDKKELPSSNLTFLIDTSGSMDSFDKLPLLKTAFNLLVDTLDEDDKVSIVTYAGNSAIVLDSATGDNKQQIMNAINNLSAGGSTAGADGINTAYKLAEKNFVQGGNNRIILATDGDFNVGISSISDLEKLISKKRESGIYLSLLGFGTGNLQDSTMETLAKNGNGNYSYINSVQTAKKVLVDELGSTLFTVANDVKAQVEFNPNNVVGYRLIGYENRQLANEDFNDDTKDAGEIGVGTDVVMLFELDLNANQSAGLKYGAAKAENADDKFGNELFEVRIRYKNPGESESKLITVPASIDSISNNNSSDFNFASSVAGFGHLLRNSQYSGNITLNQIIDLAKNNLGNDKEGYKYEYVKTLLEYDKIIR